MQVISAPLLLLRRGEERVSLMPHYPEAQAWTEAEEHTEGIV